MVKSALRLFAAALLLAGCTQSRHTEVYCDNEVIPYPVSVVKGEGGFNLKGVPFRVDRAFDGATLRAAKDFAAQLGVVTGKRGRVTRGGAKGRALNIVLDPAISPEAYTLNVSAERITVVASGRGGVLHAFATLRQMLPPAVYGGTKAPGETWAVRCCTVNDRPDLAYRGVHLDCSRHFYSVDEIKTVLRVMAEYKSNYFHWHLTDDQGWRAEIRAYPLLTEVGSHRRGTMTDWDTETYDDIPYGGFYTQKQMREVVAYADRLGITVVPEVDLPGHMLAALASYPSLGCTGGPYEVWRRWGVAEDVLCAGKETTYGFLETVLGELCDIFPGEYFHIGGDECPKGRWKECPLCQARIAELGLTDTERGTKEQYLQNYVTARMQKFLATRGKKLIGWDEIAEGELEPGATIMYWRDWKSFDDGLGKWTGEGFDVIMTPGKIAYFEIYNSGQPEVVRGEFGRQRPMRRIYDWNPYEGLTPDQAAHIVGGQANIWTELAPTFEDVCYMLFPRLLALNCVEWSGSVRPSYSEFLTELEGHQFAALAAMGVPYRDY